MAGFSKCLTAGGGVVPSEEAIKSKVGNPSQGRTWHIVARGLAPLARRFPEASMFLVAVSFLEVARG